MYDPVTLAIPLAKRIKEYIMERKELPGGGEIKKALKELGLEELYSGKGMAVLRNRWLIAIVFPRENGTVVDVIPSTGELNDALEVIAYHDRKLNAMITEILPANELEYEGNVGVEPVIVDAEEGKLESAPVLGDFREENGELYLVIDENTYERWRESGKLNTCPICGGELIWMGREAYCTECDHRVKVREDEQAH